MGKDYYSILGVEKTASQEEIKKAFKTLAKQWHPDVNPDKRQAAEEKFKEIGEAYEVLSDENKRRMYDQTGSVDFGDGQNTGFNWQNFSHFSDFSDVFDDLFRGFGGGSPFGGATSGRREIQLDLSVEISISMAESYTGTKKEIKYRRSVDCDNCKGKGFEGNVKRCRACNGSGQERIMQQNGPFRLINTITCRTCSGTGFEGDRRCSVCHGSGKKSVVEKRNIDIRPGVADGSRMLVKGIGDMENGRVGDLYIFIRVRPERGVERVGDEIILEKEIDFPEAALGSEEQITLFGKIISFNIPPGTQPNEIVKIRGMGFPKLRGTGNGDINVRINVRVPKKLSSSQKDLIAKLKEEMEKKTWFGK
ncbi:MAG: DnaJ domain-containing protein [Candidatus Thermoplasmatota archaeon]|nr:DnaJ domain-containing protein [Candidatus Thermoplasmatota archaeon]MCL5987785.1 DnaJ domain-containing protein [Candidatus Thermoplasmatota archaeon]